MILGIDESGYGPRVGPLSVAACLLRAPEEMPAVGPQLWRALAGQVIKPTEPLEVSEDSPAGVYIGDSKLVYVETWPHELERSALALVGWARGAPVATVDDVLSVLTGQLDEQPPWMASTYGRFPLSDDASLPAPQLASDIVEAASLSAHVLSARQFNEACARTENKALVNWALIAMLIQSVLEQIDEPIRIVVDRQGGRVHYEPLLEELFGDNVVLLEKTSKRSAYAIPSAGITSIEFLVSGDVHCFAVAAASIIAKYTREVVMSRLNDFFCGHIPGLERTEGYYSDGNRFIRETARVRKKLGIGDDMFVRSR